jgi:serine phosphatase RsbU (regulator of sigma subunit)/pSer/pThr/pTyr-binding forkhead associated (FHA) protein
MLLLKVTPAEGEPFDHPVEEESLTIGRSTRCDVAIADRFLSRQHARLYRVDDAWFIEDQGSRNGTFVNGRRIDDSASVNPGDVIALSASLIKVQRGETATVGSGATTDVPSTDRLLRPAIEMLRRTESPPPEVAATESSALARYAARLALLNEVHQAVARSASLDELLELILDRIFAQLQPERAEVFMRIDDGSYTCVASRKAPGSALSSLYSESLFSEVVDKSMAALVTDARSDHRFAHAESLVSAGVRSLLAAPFYDPDRAMGLIVLGSNAAVREFTEEDLELLVTLASVAALRIRNMALTQEAAERHRLEREIGLARRIQVRLLPERLPEISGYLLHGAAQPSRGVSGDYYQVTQRADGEECVVTLADVSGKGMSAAILTGYLEAVSSGPIEDGVPPHEIFRRVSGKLFRRTPSNRFATMFLGVLAPATGTVKYASAGHSPACLVRSGGTVEWLETTGLPLGLMDAAEYQLGESTVQPGDTLVVYSDGYTEAECPDDEEFGVQRLADVLVQNRHREPAELAQAVDEALENFAAGRPFPDDRTMVVIRRTE